MLTELDKEWTQGAFLNFRDNGKCDAYHAKTRVFTVISRQSSVSLGVVRWHGAWWKYTYRPLDNSIILDAACLRDIADFCDLKTNAQRAHWKTNGRKLGVPQESHNRSKT